MTNTATKPAKPSIQARARDAVCPNCAGPVVRRSTRGPMPTFCSADCKKLHGNRALVEGRAVIAFLKAWRIDRAQGEIAQRAFEQVCKITDQFNAEDLAAKRPRADLYAAKLLADGTQFFDRQHQVNAAKARARAEFAAEQAAA